MDAKESHDQTAEKLMDTIENMIGRFPGFRRAHARGAIYEAVFKPNGKGARLTTASHFHDQEVKAIVRFSHSSPDPTMADSLSPIKGMAVKLLLPDGKEANLVGATVPVFVTKKPEAFLEMMQIGRSLKNGRPRLKAMVKLIRKHPESKTALKLYRKIEAPSSFAAGHYFLIHAFYMTDDKGRRQPVKFRWDPLAKEKKKHHQESLEDELGHRLANEPVSFNLTIQLGEPGDPVNDPTKEWPEDRETFSIGKLTIHSKLIEGHEDFLFDPTITGPGIECTEDEILHFRSKAYSVSHQRRRVQE